MMTAICVNVYNYSYYHIAYTLDVFWGMVASWVVVGVLHCLQWWVWLLHLLPHCMIHALVCVHFCVCISVSVVIVLVFYHFLNYFGIWILDCPLCKMNFQCYCLCLPTENSTCPGLTYSKSLLVWAILVFFRVLLS